MTVDLVPESMMCATCRVPLTTWRLGDGELQYFHVGRLDHPVVPVPLDWTHADVRCDFCTTPVPPTAAVVHCHRFTLVYPDGSGTHHDNGEWMACEVCADLARAGHWAQLVDHFALCYELEHGRAPAGVTRVGALLGSVAENFIAVEAAS